MRITADIIVMRPSSARGDAEESTDNTDYAARATSNRPLLLETSLCFYLLGSELGRLRSKGVRSYASDLGVIYYWGLIGVTIFVVVNQLGMELKMPDLSGSDAPQQILQSAYTISYAWQRTSTLFGLQLFMLVLKSLQFLQYIKRFSLIGTTLTYAAGDIFVFFVVMAFVIAAFTFLYHFSFGTYMREFSTIGYTVYTVLLGLATLWDPSRYYEKDPVSSIILMLLFTCLCTWVVATIIIAIITEAFLKAKAEVAARLVASEQEKLRWHAKLLAWLDDDDAHHLMPPRKATAAAALGWTHVRRFVSKVPAAAAPATATPRAAADGAPADGGRASAAWGKAVDSIMHRRRQTAPPAGGAPAGAAGGGAAGGGAGARHMSTPTGRMPSCARLLLPGSGTSSEEALGSPRSALSRAKTRGIGSFLSSVRMGDRPAPDEAAQHHLKVVVWSATNVCDVGQVADPHVKLHVLHGGALHRCLLYTSPSPRDS